MQKMKWLLFKGGWKVKIGLYLIRILNKVGQCLTKQERNEIWNDVMRKKRRKMKQKGR